MGGRRGERKNEKEIERESRDSSSLLYGDIPYNTWFTGPTHSW